MADGEAGAQKDADAVALAGAYPLLNQNFVDTTQNNPAAVISAAQTAVNTWAGYNELPLGDIKNLVITTQGCVFYYPGSTTPHTNPANIVDTVSLDAQHHGVALAGSVFGLGVPEIGAHAKACLGSVVTASGLIPVGIQITAPACPPTPSPTPGPSPSPSPSQNCTPCWTLVGNTPAPNFGVECTLTTGADSGNTNGQAGNLGLLNNGSFDCSSTAGGKSLYGTEITNGGAFTTCHVHDFNLTCAQDVGGCVYSQAGVGSTPEANFFNQLITSPPKNEGQTVPPYDCDWAFGPAAAAAGLEPSAQSHDGIDQWLEAVYQLNPPAPVPGPTAIFGRRACTSPRLVSLIVIQQFPSQSKLSPIVAFAAFFVDGCQNVDNKGNVSFSATCDKNQLGGANGQFSLVGRFINILDTSGGIGAISTWSPKRIALLE